MKSYTSHVSKYLYIYIHTHTLLYIYICIDIHTNSLIRTHSRSMWFGIALHRPATGPGCRLCAEEFLHRKRRQRHRGHCRQRQQFRVWGPCASSLGAGHLGSRSPVVSRGSLSDICFIFFWCMYLYIYIFIIFIYIYNMYVRTYKYIIFIYIYIQCLYLYIYINGLGKDPLQYVF